MSLAIWAVGGRFDLCTHSMNSSLDQQYYEGENYCCSAAAAALRVSSVIFDDSHPVQFVKVQGRLYTHLPAAASWRV